MAGVTLHGVFKDYPGGVRAVGPLDFAIHDGELLVLVGPSGCGKSTTLRMIAGLETVSGGTIHIGDREVNHVPPKDRDVAMVFQNYALYPHMTVYQNMSFGLKLRYGGWLTWLWTRLVRPSRAGEVAARQRGIREEVRRAAAMLGIEPLFDRYPRQLSGGERQRVAVGRAIVRRPAVFLFDEPLSNLDARLRVEMRREIKQLHRQLATTAVYVTHDQVEALTLGDRIAVLDRGRLQQLGSPQAVYDAPRNQFVAGFIGSPAMNFIHGEAVRHADLIAFRGGGLKVSLPLRSEWRSAFASGAAARHVVLGVRPEDVALHSADPRRSAGGAATSNAPRGASPAGDARVLLCESTGDALIVDLRVGGHGLRGSTRPDTAEGADGNTLLRCKTDPRARWSAGDDVQVSFAADRCHLFDAQTELNLCAAASSPAQGDHSPVGEAEHSEQP